MSTPVLLQLRDPGTGRWQAGEAVGEGSLGALARSLGRNPLWLVLPVERVALHTIALPGRNRATWIRAVPYALEDQLAEEVDALHFALAEQALADGRIGVAVTRREMLDGQLAELVPAGLAARCCVPDVLLLPLEPGHWTVWLEGSRAVVRQGLFQGFGCEASALRSWLAVELERSDPAPTGLEIWCDDALAPADLPLAATVRQGSGWAAMAATARRQRLALDLLQGPYRPGAATGQWLLPWRTAAALALCLLAVGAARQWAEHRSLTERRDLLQARAVTLLQEVMPGSRVVDPRAQMEHRLRELGSGEAATDSSFLGLLRPAGVQLAGLPDPVRPALAGLRYANGRLDMQLDGGALEAMDTLKQALERSTSVPVDVRSSVRGDRIESTVSLLGAVR